MARGETGALTLCVQRRTRWGSAPAGYVGGGAVAEGVGGGKIFSELGRGASPALETFCTKGQNLLGLRFHVLNWRFFFAKKMRKNGIFWKIRQNIPKLQ